MTIDEVLTRARAGLHRLPCDLAAAVADGALVVDIRPAAQRAAAGAVPGALVVERNVLDWRCDPTSDARLPEVVDHDVAWVVVCLEGYTSSLAAAGLQELGLHRATDLEGGQSRLRELGLAPSPHTHSPRRTPHRVCGVGSRCARTPAARARPGAGAALTTLTPRDRHPRTRARGRPARAAAGPAGQAGADPHRRW